MRKKNKKNRRKNSSNGYSIIPYEPKYRAQIEGIQYNTFLLGRPIDPPITNKKQVYREIAYYLDKEPESAFLAIDKEGKAVGYLLGCLDDKRGPSLARFFFKTVMRAFQLPFMHRNDRRFWGGQCMAAVKAVYGISEEIKFKIPKNAGHIHINILPEARGRGIGSRLLSTFFKYAKSRGAQMIHADSWQTRLNPTRNFWTKKGFAEYSKVKTAVWESYYPEEEIYLICYVKKL